MEWLADDFAQLSDPATFESVPDEQFRRVKRASTLNRRQLGVLQAITAWRERGRNATGSAPAVDHQG